MIELAMKQITAPNRMGSHSALSSVMTISLVIRRRAFCRRLRGSTTACRAGSCAVTLLAMPKLQLLLSWIVVAIAASGARAQDVVDEAQKQRALIDAQVAGFAGETDPLGRVYF